MECLPETSHRPMLNISRWSNPLAMINHWAECKDVHSIVKEPQRYTWAERVEEMHEEIDCPSWNSIFMAELKNRFRLKFVDRIDDVFRGYDYGLLYPLDEVYKM